MKKIWETGRACSHNSANLAGAAQRPDCAPEVRTTSNVSTTPNVGKKRSRLLKVFAAGSLAFFMGLGTLCGVLIAPMGATSASNAGNLASAAQSADSVLSPEAQAKAEVDANILAGGDLGLDPENDPIIATTAGGVEIRWHMDLPVNPSSISKLSSGNLSGYAYVKMGSYNWVIIGYSNAQRTITCNGVTNLSSLASYYWNYSGYSTPSVWSHLIYDTPAASAIFAEYEAGTDSVYASSSAGKVSCKALFPNAVAASEIPGGCVLVISEDVIGGDMDWISARSHSWYNQSTLINTMNTIYTSSAGFSNAEKNRIMSIDLKTHGYNPDTKAHEICTSSAQKLFPLAAHGSSEGENFAVATYLAQNKRLPSSGLRWWLRSGKTSGAYYLSFIATDGSIAYDYYVFGGDHRARPSFVLNLC